MNTNPYARKGFGGRHQQQKEEEDIYEGYNDLAGTTEIMAATVAQGGTIASHHLGAAAGAGAGDAPIGGFGGGFGNDFLGIPGQNNMASQMRPPTSSFNMMADSGPRPMTSVKGAGYTSHGKKTGAAFDPFQQANSMTGPAPPLQQKTAASPEHQAREAERVVNRLIEESAAANLKGEMALALDKAKEAGKRERQLCRAREKAGLAEQINFDLTYAVCFNLANQYHANGMFTEALNTYSIVVKNKQYPQAGRLRVNMGNIYYAQKKYPAAIKMYRMAMDQIGNPSREMRFKIMRNIGNSFVRLGQFADAIQSYEAIMDQAPDAQTGFNLIVCYYALGDRDKMKKGFLQLLGVPLHDEDPEEEEEDESSPVKKDAVLHNDELKKEKKERYKIAARYVQMAAKLIAPVIEKDMASGFDWVIEYLKAPAKTGSPRPGATSKSGFPAISMEMEIAKGIAFLKRRKIDEAIEVFKGFEKKDAGLLDQAATNLSFLYFLEGDLKNAERYADLAVKADRYNAKALVNKANYLYVKGDLESAKELYLEAIGVEADCVEAIYNLGLANKRLGQLPDSLQAFKKLHRIIPKDPQVMYHIANLFDLLGDNGQATEWFKILHGAVPTDPKVLARLGTLYTKEEDETQAFHNFSDSYNFYPVNMEVISWLGVWYVKSDLFEDAIQFFERAAEIEPHDVKWQLMVASCYRRMNNYTAALALYKKIHKQEPENIECLKYLCTLCREHNDTAYDEYSKLLRKAERNQGAQAVHENNNNNNNNNKQSRKMEIKEEQQEQYQQQQGNNINIRGNQQRDQEQQGYSHDPFQPQLSPKSVQTVNKGVRPAAEDDEWGNDDLADDLLPL